VNRDDPSTALWQAPREEIERAVDEVVQSRSFRSSVRHRNLLRHLVVRLLDGQAATLKEMAIAVEVFERPADRFDPKQDTIVRVETRRLRERLARHYAGDGRDARLRIVLPVGSYVPQISPRPTEKTHAAATRQARDLVERGEHFLRLATSKTNLEQAIERFDQAQRESPTYAPAFVGLARAWFNLAAGWYCDAAPAGDHAIEALQRAIALDPADATAWALLGAFQYQFGQDWPSARRSFERAIALQPRSAFAHTAYGWQLTARGLLDPAEQALTHARELDPQYVNSRVHMVNLRIAQRRLDDAQREIDAMRDLAPDSVPFIGMAAALALFRHEPEHAVKLYERCQALAPDYPSVVLLLAAAHASAGRIDHAEALRREVEQRFSDRTLSPYVLAVHAAHCGRGDDAVGLIDQALDHRDPQAVLFAGDPSFDVLHTHPQWPTLRSRLGLPASV
jgi:tetratricopeptide (TPR) repeat protein